jgi:hypothetical protein
VLARSGWSDRFRSRDGRLQIQGVSDDGVAARAHVKHCRGASPTKPPLDECPSAAIRDQPAALARCPLQAIAEVLGEGYDRAVDHVRVLGAAFLAAASVAILGCGSGRGDSGGSDCANASYAAAVRFNGIRYMGLALPEGRHVGVGRPIGIGSGPCDPDVTVRAIVDVPPAAAVAVVAPGEAQTEEVFLAPGFLPAMASHPLHAAIFDVRRRWTTDLRRRCERPITLGGVVAPPHESSRLLVGGRIVIIDGRTSYHGPRHAGLPYLRGGERMTVRGRACRGTRVVARRISARR